MKTIQTFNPKDFLELGNGPSTVGSNGETIPGEQIAYLPAKARLAWFNAYCEEQKKEYALTSKYEVVGAMIIVTATLAERVGNELIPIATGLASQSFAVDNQAAAVEIAETRAKARCLGAAGFTLLEEKSSINDEGETPVDGALINRRTATSTTITTTTGTGIANSVEAETPTPPKKKRGRPKKVKEPVEQPVVVAENPMVQETITEPETTEEEFFPIPELPKLPDLVPTVDEEDLKKCLLAFFPYGRYKGEQVIDLIDNPAFAQTIEKMSQTNFAGIMVNDSLSVNTLISTLKEGLQENNKPFLKEVANKLRG
ncbi:MAG: hypothetical protein ACI37Z_03380 [Candidatus Gastranaerophilaceae bacterium]